jgi:hypothetical protein
LVAVLWQVHFEKPLTKQALRLFLLLVRVRMAAVIAADLVSDSVKRPQSRF